MGNFTADKVLVNQHDCRESETDGSKDGFFFAEARGARRSAGRAREGLERFGRLLFMDEGLTANDEWERIQ